MKVLIVPTCAEGSNTLSVPMSDSINGVVLAANIAESITIPSGAKYALFNATADFYAKYSGTAAVITDTTDGSGSELNPTLRTINTGDTISVISGETCYVTVSFYA